MASAIWLRRIMTMMLALGASSAALAGEDGSWSVAKSSGEVWITARGAEQASLKQEETLNPGDTIRTGRNGRVLLVRGKETILIAPNSVIGVPSDRKDGMSTTILQQAGSILLDVEKRNVKHFEVETPYLAAVVKGTRFRVSVNAISTSVEVSRGQVEVSDFRSGQIAEVMPGQVATSPAHGKGGLTLSGSGQFNPIEQGKPRSSSLERIPVPKGGLAAPRNGAKGQVIHALGYINREAEHQRVAGDAAHKGAVRISTALGEVRLNVQKATHGLAHGASTTPGVSRGSRIKESVATVWSDNRGSGANPAGRNGSSDGNGGATTAAATAASGSAVSAAAAAVAGTVAAAGNSNNANGNAATGNGHGNAGNGGNGNNGNNGDGNGSGNGNGNGNNGNGNGNGHGKGH